MSHAAVKTPMKPLFALSLAALAALGTWTAPAQAFNFGNIMNPNRWMGGGNRYYDNDYGPWGGGYGAPWGGYGNPWGGYGGGPWGAPYGAPYGVPYGVPGYGAPGYGAPGYGGYDGAAGYPAAPAPTGTPQPGATASRDEVEALKRRIRELEAAQERAGASAPVDNWPATPAFRPMNQQ